jgi:hypothetical protein
VHSARNAVAGRCAASRGGLRRSLNSAVGYVTPKDMLGGRQ